ncbi:hypothetical protein PFMALIP_02018 [Plasmodium falciparum MaliPS096_E11]|uniref:Uncharacterized protein n=1 Tax=Plasmodium falciparum MaliPS096_E11 TaxID=1036727 RepID=A0A024WRZ7_PLAFA|nr:hypothetical protein PFMALIP_02018 [Plasmodium falciparum MaliPS096_E11]
MQKSLNTDSDPNNIPPCVVNETYEEIIFKNPTVHFYNKFLQCNNTKIAPHKFQEHLKSEMGVSSDEN